MQQTYNEMHLYISCHETESDDAHACTQYTFNPSGNRKYTTAMLFTWGRNYKSSLHFLKCKERLPRLLEILCSVSLIVFKKDRKLIKMGLVFLNLDSLHKCSIEVIPVIDYPLS